MKLALIIPLLLMLIVQGCNSSNSSPESTSPAKSSQTTNPLDSIRGEKIINQKTGEVRPSNFDNFYSITELDLNSPSLLYTAEDFGSDFKILRQRKIYLEARNFNVILKIKNGLASKFKVINDSYIIDKTEDSTGLNVLLGDEDNQNKHWKSKNQIQLVRLDKDLSQVWQYTAKSKGYPLRALGLKKENKHFVATIEVITGCSMCTKTFELTIDEKGNCISAFETANDHSNVKLDSSFIIETFIH